jgi:hypothetical protein
VTETELMPSLVGGDTELGGSKLKRGKGFLKSNFEPLPKPCQIRLYRISKKFFGQSI